EDDRADVTVDGELLSREDAIGVRERHRIVRIDLVHRATDELFGAKPEALEAAALRERDDAVPIEGKENERSVGQEVQEAFLGEVRTRARLDRLGDVRQ